MDLDDFAIFHACVTGPGGGIDQGCDPADLDDDGDVDLADFGQFTILFTGE